MYHAAMIAKACPPPLRSLALGAAPLLILSALALPLAAAAAPPAAKSPATAGDILAASIPADWQAFPDADLLLLDFDSGRRVVIALAPGFAPVHVDNIRKLVRAGWFDGITINRVQDNYVVQWGDATEKKPLPPGIVSAPPAEYERPATGLDVRRLPYPDSYAAMVGHARGWPVAGDGKGLAWLPHCYGMVGVGRNVAPDTGTGAELYVVNGHGPRHLDRNIATVGRVLSGMEMLSALPRGTEQLGFYKEGEARPAIRSARIAADIPPAERPRFEVMKTGGPAFAAWTKARANRQDVFFNHPAGGVDICNVLPPVRPTPPLTR